MPNQAEKKRNIIAGYYTIGISAAILVLLFFISWTIPQPIVPIVNDGIEVNLGNSDFGQGDIAPAMKGEPAPEAKEEKTATPPPSQPQPQEADKEAADENDPTPAVTKTIEKPKLKVKPNDNPPVVKPVITKAPPAPPVPKPKATMGNYSGGNGKGGNNADAFNNVKNQGTAGGKGDQGKPNGNPNSDNYTGNGGTGKSGVSVSRGLGGRHIARFPSFEDDFNQNAKIAMDITVNEAGNVTSASYQGRGSTSSASNLKEIARNKAMQLKFNSGANESVGTVIFDFKLKN